MAEMLAGGDMLIRALQDEGVEYIFGYPGGSALHIYDAIFRQQKIEQYSSASRTSRDPHGRWLRALDG